MGESTLYCRGSIHERERRILTIDKAIKETKSTIIQTLNNSGLSIGIMDLLIESIYHAVHKQASELSEQPEEGKEGEADGSGEG